MKYDVIVVPNCVTLRKTTLDRLKAFQAKGGHVIFTGTIPSHVDALPSKEASAFADTCEKVVFAENTLLTALAPYRSIDVHNDSGLRVRNMLSQLRNDGDNKWLFLSHCNKMPNPDLPRKEELLIKIKGNYHPTLYDAMTGEIREVPFEQNGGNTLIRETVYDHDSLLYLLTPACDAGVSAETVQETAAPETPLTLPELMDVTLEEPNVLILDLAEAQFDDGPWQKKDEILRIDNKFRALVGYPLRTEAFPQPWVHPETEEIRHHLALRFHIQSEIAVKAPSLALENADETTLILNGEPVPSKITGYYVDPAIKTVALPDLKPGENVLELKMPYYNKFNVEALYLLGNFGVRTAGQTAVITEPVTRLTFGDICSQGLPFYGGNLTYQVPITVDKPCSLKIEATQFRCPVIKVALDGEDKGRIAFSPYSLTIDEVKPGEHLLSITSFGNRANTFGGLHNCDHTATWGGPNYWRTTGAAWAYEYQLKPSGILISPVVTEK